MTAEDYSVQISNLQVTFAQQQRMNRQAEK